MPIPTNLSPDNTLPGDPVKATLSFNYPPVAFSGEFSKEGK